jgi:hypothetical protein
MRRLKCLLSGHVPGQLVKVLGIEVCHCLRCAEPIKRSGHFWLRRR